MAEILLLFAVCAICERECAGFFSSLVHAIALQSCILVHLINGTYIMLITLDHVRN